MLNAYIENTLRFDQALCNNCVMCTTVCPHAVFLRNNGVVKLAYPERCMECGACRLNCPTGAISVESGVGCASAMMLASIRGRKMEAATCDCGC
jgi:NAD-dependent dihydropyrimidine dehydrogenase PreA subunit